MQDLKDQVKTESFLLTKDFLNHTYTLTNLRINNSKTIGWEHLHSWVDRICNRLPKPKTLKDLLSFIIIQG